MRRHRHDGAGAVFGQDVVGDPDGQAFTVEWIDGVVAGEDAVLFDCADIAGFARLFLLFEQGAYFFGQLFVLRGKLLDQRMLGRELHAGRAEDRVDARGEDGDLAARCLVMSSSAGKTAVPVWRILCLVVRRMGSRPPLRTRPRAFAAPDPVALHGAHLFRPAAQACPGRRAVPARSW